MIGVEANAAMRLLPCLYPRYDRLYNCRDVKRIRELRWGIDGEEGRSAASFHQPVGGLEGPNEGREYYEIK